MSLATNTLPEFPFSLRHFFEGALCREEVVSACLAMLLEGSSTFRAHFFSHIGDEQLMHLSDQAWKVEVEKNEVDICLTHEKIILLIENKTNAAALQQGQLVRYYRQHRMESPKTRIVAVLLAPGRVGRSEVEFTKQTLASDFDHYIGHVSWEDVLAPLDSFADLHRPWILGILSFISQTISQQREQRYEFVEDRGVLSELINELLVIIRSNSELRVMPDKRQKTQEVYSIKNSCTMGVGFRFESSAESDHIVTGLTQADGSLHVIIRSYFRLSKAGERLAVAAKHWRQLSNAKSINIANVGEFILLPDFSYLWEESTTGTRVSILARMLEVWSLVESFARERGIINDVK